MIPSRLSTSRTRAMLPIRPVPDSRLNDAPVMLRAARAASGRPKTRVHQPWTSARLASIVLLKTSAVGPNRNRTRSVRRTFVATTAGSMVPASGPPMYDTIWGTYLFGADGPGGGTTAPWPGDDVGPGGLVA